MDITVILCTYNRCDTLAKALDSVTASLLPSQVKWEVLVVDNNSSDQTRSVVEGYCRSHPGLCRYLFEPRQGLSQARNAGIREAHGNVLAFLDDDVTVEPMWLENLTAGLRTGEWMGAGGRILLAHAFSPPRWLLMDGPYGMGGVLCAHFDLGDEPRELHCAPHGTNMAYRREMFEKHGGYRTDLGRCAGSLLSNEDTEFGRRLLAAGERLRYEPSAVVYHPAPTDRLRKEYFLTWWFDYGRALVREWGRKPDLFGIPRAYLSILKLAASSILQIVRWMLTFHPQRRFYYKCRTCTTFGEIREFCRQSRNPRYGDDRYRNSVHL